MARVKNKKPISKELLKKILLGVGITICSAVAVTVIVILIIWIVRYFDKPSDEKEYKEAYENAELLTYEELEDMLDNDTHSGLASISTYIYVYSPDFDKYENGDNAEYKSLVDQCISSYASATNEDYSFYVLNVASEDNESASTDFLQDCLGEEVSSIPSDTPYLMIITNTSNGPKITSILTKSGEIKNNLNDALSLVTE